MKRKGMLWIGILVLAAVLGGAYLLYRQLSDHYQQEQLVPDGQNTEDGESETEQERGQQEASLAPDFTVYDNEGNAVNLSDYFGRPVVLNFWASWCGPCKSEMPEFDAKSRELEGEVVFLMVNMTGGRETKESAESYVNSQGFSFPVFYDLDLDAAQTYSVYSLPTTYFIDENGNLSARANGAIDGDTLQQGIDLIYKSEK